MALLIAEGGELGKGCWVAFSQQVCADGFDSCDAGQANNHLM